MCYKKCVILLTWNIYNRYPLQGLTSCSPSSTNSEVFGLGVEVVLQGREGMGRGEVAGDSSQNTSLSGLSGSGELQVESLVGCPLVLLTVSNS